MSNGKARNSIALRLSHVEPLQILGPKDDVLITIHRTIGGANAAKKIVGSEDFLCDRKYGIGKIGVNENIHFAGPRIVAIHVMLVT